MRAGPRLEAEPAVDGVPALEAAHAHGRQVVRAALELDADARAVVLPRREEEGAVDERVAVEDGHGVGAHHARRAVHLVRRVRREDEDARLVVADRALVLHLSKIFDYNRGFKWALSIIFTLM